MGTVEPYETASGKRYMVRYRTPDRRQTMKRGFTTKRDAQQHLATVEVSKMRGEWIDATRSRMSVRDAAEMWFAAQLQIKPTTRVGYRQALDKHVLPVWGDIRLSEVSHSEVQRWVLELTNKLGPSMVRQQHLVLSGVFKLAVRDGRLVRNPSEDVRLPRIVKTRRGYLTHEQLAQVSERCGQSADIVLFLAYTGVRWGEMAALKADRVDISRRRVEIAEAVSEPRGLITWGTPKSHERRSVPFPEFLTPRLRLRCEGKHPDDLVFAGSAGAVLRAGNFRNRVFDAAVASAIKSDSSIPRVTLHDLRHTAASLAVSAGANVKAVQRMLGHASAAMTLDVYADLFDDDLDAVAEALNQAVPAAVVLKMCSTDPASESKKA